MKLFIVASICFIINQQRAVWEWFSRPLLGCLGFQRFLALGELGPKLWAVSPPALRNPWFLPLQSESEKHLLPRELLGLCGEVFISCWNMQTSPCSSFRTLFFFSRLPQTLRNVVFHHCHRLHLNIPKLRTSKTHTWFGKDSDWRNFFAIIIAD